MVVGNYVGGSETGFECDLNEVVLTLRTGETIPLPRATKREIADRIFDEILLLRLNCMPPMNAERLRQYLEFYQDLGVKSLYRRSAAEAPAAPAAQAQSQPDPSPMELPPLAPSDDTLLKIIEDMGDCKRCRLHEARNKIVFGVGNGRSPLVFVGEGPGADEDAQGIPFVGRAGQLLTQMIEGTAKKEGIQLARADVYICNVVKCRPPGNRTPEPDEMEICGAVPLPPAFRDPAESDLRARRHRGPRCYRPQRGRHQDAR